VTEKSILYSFCVVLSISMISRLRLEIVGGKNPDYQEKILAHELYPYFAERLGLMGVI